MKLVLKKSKEYTRQMRLLLVFVTLSIQLTGNAQPFGYSYSKIVTIDAANVSGATDHLDFPVLLHFTDPNLRSTANGGHVYSNTGDDIIFTEDDCSQSLFHQLERYIPTTGEVLVWVRIPLLFATTNTTFQMYYGNSTVLTPTSSPNTWCADYKMVQHLEQNPGNVAPQMQDASPNGNNGTALGGMTVANSVVGMIDEALQFDGTNDYIVIPGFDYSSAPLGFSVSFWFKVVDNSGASYQYMYSHNNYGLQHSLNVYFAEDAVPVAGDLGELKTIFMDQNDAISTEGLDTGAGYADGNWHYYTFVVGNAPGGDWVYVDGIQKATLGFQGSDPFAPPGNIYLGARSDLNATRYLKGFLDEVHISIEPRSIDWIITEFQNQTTPIGFATFSAEFTALANCSPLPVELVSFNVTTLEERNVLADWITETEINSDYFVVQRTLDGITFEDIGVVESAGNTLQTASYALIDEHAYSGTSYYRLKQVDLDGSFEYSDLKSVNFSGISLINSYPNPASEEITFIIYSTLATSFDVTVTDAIGRLVEHSTLSIKEGTNVLDLSLAEYAKGQYLLSIGNETTNHLSQVFYVH